MSEFLSVRLSRDTNAPVPWLVWSTSQNEVIASGELAGKEQIEDLLPYANQRTVIAILDSREVVLKTVDVPAGASRQLENMLPYLMEDDIAQDVDELHFSILSRASGQASIAAIDERYFSGWLKAFDEIGIEFKQVLPDVLALPVHDDAVSAMQLNNVWLFRKSLYQGMVVEKSWLKLFLESDWCKSEDAQLPVTSYTEVPEEAEKDDQNWQLAEPELVMLTLTQGAIASRVNLLTGKFKPQSSIFKHLKVWRKVAIAACLFLVIYAIQQVMQVNQHESLAQAYRDESERIFRTVFPDKRKIPTTSYLKKQMRSEISRLSGSSSGESVINWLSGLPDMLKKHPEVEITSLRYDANRGEVRVETLMSDFQTYEVVRAMLSEQYGVTQGPLNKENDKVSGSFVLRRKQ